LKSTTRYETLISFIIGVAWFLVLAGALWGAMHFGRQHSFMATMAGSVIGMIPGLILLLLAHNALTQHNLLLESKKQTEQLDKLLDVLGSSMNHDATDTDYRS